MLTTGMGCKLAQSQKLKINGTWMYDIRKTDYYQKWFDNLDETIKGRIRLRIKRAECGNFGDVESVGDGVYEMRFKRLGCRLYYCQRDRFVYLLLIGGDKNTRKDQTRDIERAKEIKLEAQGGRQWW
jgi:putative addiction module killer protein